MSETSPEGIVTTVEFDGSVMMNAADVVTWIRHRANLYGSGELGGNVVQRKAAHEALTSTADGIQTAYIDACADEATYRFGGSA